MSKILFQKAMEIAKHAITLDEEGNYGSAIKKYTESADILMRYIQLSTNPEMKRICYERAQEYIKRAGELRGARSSGRRPVRRVRKGGKGGGKSSEPISEEKAKLRDAISETIIIEKPDIKLTDVANLETAKQALRESIILPILRPDLFTGGRQPWKGILLYGPPGCGKTYLSKAIATECDATFLNADAASLVSKWLGESERLIKELFALAREEAPSIVFIDEVDSIATVRGSKEMGGERRIKTQLLIEMDGMKAKKDERIIILGATNRPWDLDAAFRRRFEKKISISLPDDSAREKIFEIHTREVDLAKDIKFKEFAKLTEGYTGSDISLLCREAVMLPIREIDVTQDIKLIDKVRPVSRDDFISAMEKIKPVISPEELKRYDEWTQQFGTE
ncbi:MAG: AAA family ATPase [Promethearchaeota archaeon]|nr:MAG: AAA family ATPase [Candidatus Lokiarchaeota archaeon]